MSKNLLIVSAALLILIASIAFDISQKRAYYQNQAKVQKDIDEIKSVAAMQRLWKAKGIKSKINRILNLIPANKRKNVKLSRSKAQLNLSNLSDRELNKVLSKLAMLPIEFKSLNIKRENQNYSLECLCVW